MQVLLFSAIAGVVGLGSGGVLAALLLKRPSENITSVMLTLASGIMISIVCFGLVPEALKISGVWVSMAGIVAGILIIMALNRLVDRISAFGGGGAGNGSIAVTAGDAVTHPRIYRTGIFMLIAIGVHTIPEGMAIGAGGSQNTQLGMLLVVMITAHHIPEGMAIATPLLAGGMSRWKAIALPALAGSPTLLGGVIGILIGNISELAVAAALSAAGGAMLYVVFMEVIPQAITISKNRNNMFVILLGLLVGLVISQV